MPAPVALSFALDLLRQPLLAGVMREQPIPSNLLLLIQLAAADEEAVDVAVEATELSPARIREAAILYLQNVLWAGKPDHYRALGVSADASQEQLRSHFMWMMKWLHPDRTRNDWDSAFAPRVLAAWDALKTPERRAAYDAILAVAAGDPKPKRGERPKIRRPRRGIPWIGQSPTLAGTGVALLRLGTSTAGLGRRILSSLTARASVPPRVHASGRERSRNHDLGGPHPATDGNRASRVAVSNPSTDNG